MSFEIALYAGEIRVKLRTQGKTRSEADMLISATAKIHKLTLVTHNIRDFEGCEILLFNPFS
ncbi:MAG: type II toxin-antitoxin system VapC family toxin [Microcystis aeruginosa Ma_QC_Ch_20071001_S25]|uniref:Type II toxin-antitoxin system VapC family toxin n=5 Tax=Microcystis TaxID=1125 RepID=A0A552HD46_MICVR|nr:MULTISPECIES: PIN domain-containing protein [Microcystis]NCR07166.1 type II toxin-antitoxin system VapC family toxin [Microcystis aeruginosa LG13-11]NCR11776.1 type II toxin-antitoxin system VapC family toxin [Microcystis aeruginosa SX13-11]NCR17455.1 type II toxin-antitoxin system VapC family toxin [Microcystis aeruginosa LL13-03]NCR41513.1 type II toxin-antitoxin system VapC family toxin [Microcystis aeruginosa W13-11]NCR43107.1 type II toxin-antitoxin system VapC family toxin [Microcysti